MIYSGELQEPTDSYITTGESSGVGDVIAIAADDRSGDVPDLPDYIVPAYQIDKAHYPSVKADEERPQLPAQGDEIQLGDITYMAGSITTGNEADRVRDEDEAPAGDSAGQTIPQLTDANTGVDVTTVPSRDTTADTIESGSTEGSREQYNLQGFLDGFGKAYYESVDPGTGQHPMARIIDSLSKLPGVREKGINVEATIKKSLSPKYLREEGVDTVEQVLRSGGQVCIWSVGDEGEYTDPETGITHPAINAQQQKIVSSGIKEKLIGRLGGDETATETVNNNFQVVIRNKNKRAALRRENELDPPGILDVAESLASEIFVVDDQPRNLENISGNNPVKPGSPPITTYYLNNSHESGNISAFRKYISEHLKNSRSGVPFLIADWDDVLWDEQQRIHDLGLSFYNAVTS